MLIRMMIFTGLCVGSLSAMKGPEANAPVVPDDVSKVTRIVVFSEMKGNQKSVGIDVTIKHSTTIKDVAKELARDFLRKDTLPVLCALYKSWWPTVRGWRPAWSEQASAVLDDTLTVHEAMRMNNNTTRFKISCWRVE